MLVTMAWHGVIPKNTRTLTPVPHAGVLPSYAAIAVLLRPAVILDHGGGGMDTCQTAQAQLAHCCVHMQDSRELSALKANSAEAAAKLEKGPKTLRRA
jgi:hypothetical protein